MVSLASRFWSKITKCLKISLVFKKLKAKKLFEVNLFHLLNINKYMVATCISRIKWIYSSISREPVQEIDRSIELELELISYHHIQEPKSMVYISARYTYQWINFQQICSIWGVRCIIAHSSTFWQSWCCIVAFKNLLLALAHKT